jgi:hypothetical protein
VQSYIVKVARRTRNHEDVTLGAAHAQRQPYRTASVGDWPAENLERLTM